MQSADFFHIPWKGQQPPGILLCLQTPIPDWDTFERIFKRKYVAQKTHAALMKGLGALKKERKEKVHNFTQRFSTYVKNFYATDKPSDKVLIEYYTSALGPYMDMFEKSQVKPTLLKTYEEAERVEAEK